MQPPPMLQNQARIGSTAIVSLIFGISAVILGPFTGILAVITGHLALWRIKRSGGALRGKGLAVAGLILGYGFSALSVIPDHLAIRKVKTITTLATAASIEAAVDSFHTEYGSLPSDAGADLTIHTHADTRLLEVLLGLDVKRNPREIRFLSVKEGKNRRNGLIHAADGRRVTGLYDAWGGGYHVLMDANGDGKLNVNPTTGEVVKGRKVVVWSDGPDRKPGTTDDVKTW